MLAHSVDGASQISPNTKSCLVPTLPWGSKTDTFIPCIFLLLFDPDTSKLLQVSWSGHPIISAFSFEMSKPSQSTMPYNVWHPIRPLRPFNSTPNTPPLSPISHIHPNTTQNLQEIVPTVFAVYDFLNVLVRAIPTVRNAKCDLKGAPKQWFFFYSVVNIGPVIR